MVKMFAPLEGWRGWIKLFVLMLFVLAGGVFVLVADKNSIDRFVVA